MKNLSKAERLRYARHIQLEGVGAVGQQTLKRSRVLIVGAGGLGSPCAMYLAAAGVGVIGLVDMDRVEMSNLQRQLLHSDDDVGKPKVESAKNALRRVNPYVEVHTHPVRLEKSNALEILRGYDLVVDGTDNFETRYLISDACVTLGKPNIYGSLYQFEGQVSVFDAAKGPCYRCLYPHPPKSFIPNCSDAGVLGVLPGLVGSIQANEALKVLLGIGTPLIGRLLHLDTLSLEFRSFRIKKNKSCIACGKAAHPEALVAPLENRDELSPIELKERLSVSSELTLVDVRSAAERSLAEIGGANIPLGELPERIAELRGASQIVVLCHKGVRSKQAAELLRRSGFRNVASLAGGIDRWSVDVDPSVPRY
ncbi:MAG: molybdopterin-synthase adenylyltransferase MoeB [Bdellovibrionales bacterium]|nr:molybdopterin-synthase adenylyltransferase MoeB [Bdellovibrionales bacterium]